MRAEILGPGKEREQIIAAVGSELQIPNLNARIANDFATLEYIVHQKPPLVQAQRNAALSRDPAIALSTMLRGA